MTVYCVNQYHPEGVETLAICNEKSTAMTWIKKNEPSYERKRTKDGTDWYWQCPYYWDMTISIDPKEVLSEKTI